MVAKSSGSHVRTFAHFLLNKRYWWLQFAIVAAVGSVGLLALGAWTYNGAPPIAPFVSSASGEVVIPIEQVNRGKEVFHVRSLMTWGSFWGDGAERGPDFTADALHRTVVAMRSYYENEIARSRAPTQADEDAITVRIQRELHTNEYSASEGKIRLNDAQLYALQQLNEHYRRMFTDASYPDRFALVNYINNLDDIRALTAYFFWGAWVSAANRPGERYSYTQNWPFDPDAANTPPSPIIFWSILSLLGLFAGTMLVLYVYGQMKELPGDPFNGASGLGTLTTPELEQGLEHVKPTQRLTYKFFAFAVVLFLIQVLAGILSAEDFLHGGPGMAIVKVLGITLPFTVVRAWHAILQIYWFFMCWVGYTIFFLPGLSNVPRGQRHLINLLFVLSFVVGLGALFGIYFAQTGAMTDTMAYWFGTQGWEFMELGRFWHLLMLAAFVLWIVIIFRGVRRWITRENLWSVPAWLFYGSGIMVLFLFFGLGATPRSNFAISDYWRWMTVHMWVEVTFEVFTTCIVGYMLVQMGLLKKAMAERVIFLAVMMFLITAVVGISHNFYWIAKPEGIIALGSIFSTMQVLPLLLITLDAWRMRNEKVRALANQRQGKQSFVMDGVWMFIVAVNIWNIIGAGVFGSLINLPIVNYFEHSTYLTGSHAHAAMFGVKGNVALAGLLFCCQHLLPRAAWSEKIVQRIFWSLNLGIVLMMLLDLFPVGLYQVSAVLGHGFWYARTEAFVTGPVFKYLTLCRTLGGVLFLFGGVVPLVWFILSRAGQLLPEADQAEPNRVAEASTWAGADEGTDLSFE